MALPREHRNGAPLPAALPAPAVAAVYDRRKNRRSESAATEKTKTLLGRERFDPGAKEEQCYSVWSM